MDSDYFYLEFKINETESFEKLEKLFTKIKKEKDIYIQDGNLDRIETIDWINYLDEKSLEWFSNVFDFHSEEGKTYRKLWELTKPDIRIKHPMFNIDKIWEFESLIDTIFQGEYELISISKLEDKGKLKYNPWAGPFGGTESLVELIESFGNEVTYDYWHNGPHKRQKCKWNYQLAKKLVEQNKGIDDKKWWEIWGK